MWNSTYPGVGEEIDERSGVRKYVEAGESRSSGSWHEPRHPSSTVGYRTWTVCGFSNVAVGIGVIPGEQTQVSWVRKVYELEVGEQHNVGYVVVLE